MRFKIKQSNINEMARLIGLLRNTEGNLLKLEITQNNKDLPRYSDIMPGIYKLLDYELYFAVWLIDFPYCAVAPQARDHIITENTKSGEKINKCKKCKYYKICAGFPAGYFKKFGKLEVEPIPDLPTEVMIEVEPQCNFSCAFCYNNNSFAKTDRNIKSLTATYIKKIINNTAKNGIKIIRFTGGEPMLRKDIFELMKYTKGAGLEVRLNTNCSLINSKNIAKFKGLVDNVLIPIESYDSEEECRITGDKNALKKKINAIKIFKKIGVSVVRVGSVVTKENIMNFNKLADFILGLSVDEWELYRPISIDKNSTKLSRKEINKLVNNIIQLGSSSDKIISIANAIPFCAISDPKKLNFISKGALFDDGHSRLVVDPRGYAKPHYFIDKNIGDPCDIMTAWNHTFMKKMRNLEFLPVECRECKYKFKCRGGSRFEAWLRGGRMDALDPMAKMNNIF